MTNADEWLPRFECHTCGEQSYAGYHTGLVSRCPGCYFMRAEFRTLSTICMVIVADLAKEYE